MSIIGNFLPGGPMKQPQFTGSPLLRMIQHLLPNQGQQPMSQGQQPGVNYGMRGPMQGGWGGALGGLPGGVQNLMGSGGPMGLAQGMAGHIGGAMGMAGPAMGGLGGILARMFAKKRAAQYQGGGPNPMQMPYQDDPNMSHLT